MIMQSKTKRPVQFEVTQPARTAVAAWIEKAERRCDQYLFPSRLLARRTTRQCARMVHQWGAAIGLDPTAYGTHTMRRTKATLIY
uniref:Tyr recombinase domain-containing protein n=1 Tax=Paraburkholderia sprentiae WSM5005 TaxID=754502 RepID=A0A1I9YR03_9BURK